MRQVIPVPARFEYASCRLCAVQDDVSLEDYIWVAATGVRYRPGVGVDGHNVNHYPGCERCRLDLQLVATADTDLYGELPGGTCRGVGDPLIVGVAEGSVPVVAVGDDHDERIAEACVADRTGLHGAGHVAGSQCNDKTAGVADELRRRGHQVNEVPALGVSGCATVVMLDPATGNRVAAADPRRDCYAIAY